MPEYIYVPKGPCGDCPLLYGSKKLPQEQLQKAMQHMREEHITMECLTVTFARYQGSMFPDCVCCYVYFYQFWHEKPELVRMVEEGRVKTIDISGYALFSESHLKFVSSFCSCQMPYDQYANTYISPEEWEKEHEK